MRLIVDSSVVVPEDHDELDDDLDCSFEMSHSPGLPGRTR
jgi:hypothetical protein